MTEMLELENAHLVSRSVLVLEHPAYYYPMIKTQYGWSDGKTTVWNDEWEWRKAQENGN